MFVVGINESHNASAAILKDGKIVACISEERLTRVKGQGGFPKKSLDFCLRQTDIKISDIDIVVFGFKDPLISSSYSLKKKRSENWFWQTKKIIPRGVREAIYKLIYPILRRQKQLLLAKKLKISPKKIFFIDHHEAHALTAYYFFGRTEEKSLVITNDGRGDSSCGKIYLAKSDKLRLMSETPNNDSLAAFYFAVTKYLGFKPDEEEYKVMGLAPYGNDKSSRSIYKDFHKLFKVRNLGFKSEIPVDQFDSFLNKILANKRFDCVAYALQKMAEELVWEQVQNAVAKTGAKRVVLGGGLAMNVKANGKVGRSKSIKKLLVCPSPGDESTALGACFFGYKLLAEKNKISFKPQPILDLYLGPSYEGFKARSSSTLKVKKLARKNIASEIARLLSLGEVIARFSGRGEFGARALGNRSILASPKDTKVVKFINDSIKHRDFWLPFAPTILDIDAKAYLERPNNFDSPYMMIAYEATEKAKKEIPAALHPVDFTCRAQILAREQNPDYYDIILEFKKITGIGALLNTSFNLHGEPIVCTPQDAIRTFKKSGLKYLIIESYLITKRP